MYIGDRIRIKYVDKYLPYAKNEHQECLDLGCGGKIYEDVVLKHNYDYRGMDKNPVNESVIKIDLDNEDEIIRLVKYHSYSAILCVDVLEHLKNPLVVISYLYDLLNTHGHIIIHTPNVNQTHLLIEPEPNPDHVCPGFEPLQIEGILGKFFSKLQIIPTFNWNEAMAWDLNYIMPDFIHREKLLYDGIEKLIKFNYCNFVPYGMLIIGEK